MQVTPPYGVSRGCNGATSPVARQVAPGLGVSTPSNLDSTRLRVVKRGCVVEFPGGATARVARVRSGVFYTDARVSGTGFRFHPCRLVRVIA